MCSVPGTALGMLGNHVSEALILLGLPLQRREEKSLEEVSQEPDQFLQESL